MRKNNNKQILFTGCIAVIMVGIISILLVSTLGMANLDPLLWVNPESLIIPPGQPTNVNLQLDNIINVYGAQVSLDFDPAVIEVVDADPVTPGIQIIPGSCPYPDFIVVNTADNGSGTIDYAVTQLYPRPACNGGTLASITFQCVAPSGTSEVIFTETIISNPDGEPISHATQGGEITCLESTDTPTPTNTSTPSPTFTRTATPTITNTSSPTWTRTPSPTPSTTASPTPSGTPTETATPTISPTPSTTASPTPSGTPTETATSTHTPTPTNTFTPTYTSTPTTTQEPGLKFYLPIIYRLYGS